MQRTMVAVLVAFGLLVSWGAAQAASFSTALVFSDNRGWDAAYYSASAAYFMTAYALVDTDEYNVYVQDIPDGDTTEQLYYDAAWSVVDPHSYAKVFSSPAFPGPGSTWEREYTFFIDENGDGDYDAGTDASATSNLPTVSQMPIVDTAESSGGLHPRITWDDVDGGTAAYRLRFFALDTGGNPTGPPLLDERIVDDDSDSYFYDYEGDLFETYASLAIRIEARDSTETLQNRSSYYTQSTVPIPSALWMLGSGLLGLLGVRRRRRRC